MARKYILISKFFSENIQDFYPASKSRIYLNANLTWNKQNKLNNMKPFNICNGLC